MTNELIKVLVLFALYGALEIALFSSSIGRLLYRTVRASLYWERSRLAPVKTLSDDRGAE